MASRLASRNGLITRASSARPREQLKMSPQINMANGGIGIRRDRRRLISLASRGHSKLDTRREGAAEETTHQSSAHALTASASSHKILRIRNGGGIHLRAGIGGIIICRIIASRRHVGLCAEHQMFSRAHLAGASRHLCDIIASTRALGVRRAPRLCRATRDMAHSASRQNHRASGNKRRRAYKGAQRHELRRGGRGSSASLAAA